MQCYIHTIIIIFTKASLSCIEDVIFVSRSIITITVIILITMTKNLAFLLLCQPVISTHRLVSDDEGMVKLSTGCVVPSLNLKCVLKSSSQVEVRCHQAFHIPATNILRCSHGIMGTNNKVLFGPKVDANSHQYQLKIHQT